MYLEAETTDDLMREVFDKLIKRPCDVKASRGNTSEIFGALLRLRNPRARLSRTETKGTPFSALGEFLWYFSKTNELDFIAYYLRRYTEESDDGKTVHGGYGPRLFNMRNVDQIGNVLALLKKKETSRRAVIQLFNAEDIDADYKEIPCTCTLQFAIRESKLHMFTSMRSNDAFYGLPHDIFSFTMLQEILAKELSLELGYYNHAVGSLHLYEDKIDKAKQYISEGYQSTTFMPVMPNNTINSVYDLLKVEEAIRTNKEIPDTEFSKLDPYWRDLAYMLKIFRLQKDNDIRAIEALKTKITNQTTYFAYIDDCLARIERRLAEAK